MGKDLTVGKKDRDYKSIVQHTSKISYKQIYSFDHSKEGEIYNKHRKRLLKESFFTRMKMKEFDLVNSYK